MFGEQQFPEILQSSLATAWGKAKVGNPGRIHVAPAFRFHPHDAERSLRRTLGVRLLADAEFRNDSLVPFGIVLLQVVEQATPLADKHEQTPA